MLNVFLRVAQLGARGQTTITSQFVCLLCELGNIPKAIEKNFSSIRGCIRSRWRGSGNPSVVNGLHDQAFVSPH